MLGIRLARGAAATQRRTAGLALRRPRVTPAGLQGGFDAPAAGAVGGAGAVGLRRQLATAVDEIDSSSGTSSGSFGGEAVGQHEVGPAAQQWQGQQLHDQNPRQPARYGGDRTPRNHDRSRSNGGRHSSYRGGGGGGGGAGVGGGRGWGGRGGEFARSRADRNGGMSRAWQYSKAIGELKRTGDWIRIIMMYQQACDDERVHVNRIMFNSTIAALARSPKWKVALSIFEEMREDDEVAPDTYTFNAALMACVHGRQEDLAFALLGEMRAADVAPDSFTFSHLVAACGHQGRWEKALALVGEMKRAGLKPNCITYNGVIVSLGNGGEPDRAAEVLHTMREEGVQVSEGSFSSAIAACGKARRWERALQLLEEMKEGRDNLEPNEYCYNSAISGGLLGRGACWVRWECLSVGSTAVTTCHLWLGAAVYGVLTAVGSA